MNLTRNKRLRSSYSEVHISLIFSRSFPCNFKLFRVKHMLNVNRQCGGALCTGKWFYFVHPASASAGDSDTAQLYKSLHRCPEWNGHRTGITVHRLDRQTPLTGAGLHHGHSRAGHLRTARPGAAARRSRRDRRLALAWAPVPPLNPPPPSQTAGP
jgi:hypothetical protein